MIGVSASALPGGVTASLAPQNILPGQTATLSLNSTSGAVPAIYRFNVNGRSGSLGDSHLTELVINGPGISPADPDRVRCTFGANPSIIVQPVTSSLLSWSCQNAQACSISPNVGNVDPVSGSVTVSPTSTTSYILFCTNNAEIPFSVPADVQVYTSGRVEILPR